MESMTPVEVPDGFAEHLKQLTKEGVERKALETADEIMRNMLSSAREEGKCSYCLEYDNESVIHHQEFVAFLARLEFSGVVVLRRDGKLVFVW